MPEIKVTTSADLKGFRDLEAAMDRMLTKSKQVSELWKGIGSIAAGTRGDGPTTGGASVMVPAGGGPPHPPSRVSQDHRRNAKIGAGSNSRYNLDNPGGVISYYENVLSQALPTLGGMPGARTGSMNLGAFGRFRYQPVGMSTVQDSDVMNWFTGLSRTIGSLSDSVRRDFFSAVDASQNSTSALPQSVRQFYQQYGSSLGGPTAQPMQQSFGSRIAQHFRNNFQGKSLGQMFMGGVKGAIGGGIVDAVTGDATAGMAASGTIGELAGGPVGAVTALAVGSIIKAITNQIGQGIQNFQQTIPVFSQLSHALDNATNSAVGFQESVQMAGATVAMTNIQSTQVAQTLAQTFGNSVGTNGLASLTKLVGANALINGIDPNVEATLTAAVAGLGITNGKGASMTPSQNMQMFLNMVKQSGMQGRQQSLQTGLVSVYSQLGSMSPIITSANSTAAIYTAMNGTGIQGLQGQSGANILNQINSSLGSGKGISGILGMAAINQASGGKITNPWQMLSIMQQGVGAKVGNTTLGKQLAQMIQQMGGDIYTQAGILSQFGISENQALAMLKSGALNATSISTSNNQTTRLTTSDQNTSASAITQVETGRIGYLKNLVNNAVANIAGGSSTVSATGATTNDYTLNTFNNRGPIQPLTTNQVIAQNDSLSDSVVPASLSKSQKSFVQTVLPYAKIVAKKTGFTTNEIIAQWAFESDWGQSEAAQQNANLGGIIPVKGLYKAGVDPAYAGFNNLSQFALAYISTMNSSRYSGARKLAKSGGNTQDVFALLTQEGYDGSDPTAYGKGVAADAASVDTIIPWASSTSATLGSGSTGTSSSDGGTVSLSQQSIYALAQAFALELQNTGKGPSR